MTIRYVDINSFYSIIEYELQLFTNLQTYRILIETQKFGSDQKNPRGNNLSSTVPTLA